MSLIALDYSTKPTYPRKRKRKRKKGKKEKKYGGSMDSMKQRSECLTLETILKKKYRGDHSGERERMERESGTLRR